MSKTKDSFSAGETARITKVPYRTLDHWARTKFIVPSIADADGIGTERKYAFNDLVALRVARELREAGVSTKSLHRIVERLRSWKNSRNPLTEYRLVVVGSDVQVVLGYEKAMSLLRKPGQAVFAFMIDVGRAVQEIKQEVQALRAA